MLIQSSIKYKEIFKKENEAIAKKAEENKKKENEQVDQKDQSKIEKDK